MIAGCWVHARRKFDEALKVLPQKRRADTLAGNAVLLIKNVADMKIDALGNREVRGNNRWNRLHFLCHGKSQRSLKRRPYRFWAV